MHSGESKDREPGESSAWALARFWRRCREGFGRDWHRVDGKIKLQALGVLIAGFIVCAGFSYGMCAWVRTIADDGLNSWDRETLLWLVEHGYMNFVGAIMAESPGNLVYLMPLTTAAALLAFYWGRAFYGLAILIAYWGARPVVLIGWQAWNRARPDLVGDGIAAPGLHAFPSGHAALSTAAYGLLAYLWIRAARSTVERTLAVALTSLFVLWISYGRVRLGAHWPSDLVSGVIVGGLWLAVVIWVLKWIEGNKQPV